MRHLLLGGLLGCGLLTGLGIARSRAGAQTSQEAAPRSRQLQAAALIPALQPLAQPMPEPGPHDWLSQHHEPGQSFEQYAASDPITAWGARRRLCVQPLGTTNDAQRRVVELAADWMSRFFGLDAEVLERLPLSLIPERARRNNPYSGQLQLNSRYILEQVLARRVPEDALALLAFTPVDLYPAEDWNFVFGQALLFGRAGVWSTYRFGRLGGGKKRDELVLQRALKLATHETGHMLSMGHCTAHACNMNGSNHLEEADGQPAWLCPQCTAKLCYATGAKPLERTRALLDFCLEHGLEEEGAYYQKAVQALEGGRSP